jgi:tetratricopeptide (TPR) repeat protein
MATNAIRFLLCLMGAALLGACATEPQPTRSVHEALFENAAFAPPTQAPNVAAVFALSPAMQTFLNEDIAALQRKHGAKHGFIEALRSQLPLQLDYDAEITRTAAEAFEARAGNCLSLVVMTAALAKQLDLPVIYQALVGASMWSRVGTERGGHLIVANGHVNLVVAQRLIDRVSSIGNATQIVIEFGALPPGRGQAMRPVGEAMVLAMFMNNRAAEFLVRGQIDNAYAHARQAVLEEPAYAAAYNTLGVIYQRRGLAFAAERAWRAGLEREPNEISALMNLRDLLESQSRHAEAQLLRQRVAQLEAHPPFEHFDRAVAAARAGDYATARKELAPEMRRDPDYHEFHFWLAVALFGLGDVDQARKHLTLAMNNSVTRSQQQLYEAKLRGLASQLAPAR